MPVRRVHLLFEGHVQGVGFRFTAVEVARAHGIGGYVRNLPNGDVELEAEAEAGLIDRYLIAVKTSRLASFIRAVHQWESTPVGSREFEIRS